MANINQVRCICSKCGKAFEASVPTVVNISEDPELKSRVISGELFVASCPVCGAETVVRQPFLYLDPASRHLVLLTDAEVDDKDMDKSLTARKVSTVGELIEKVKIFDAGLDDVVLELCKFVTCRELEKDVELKFLKLDGADNEIIMTYPEKDHMEMLAIGFNVYEDCRGIVSRNPALSEAAKGLATINQAWLARFIG